MGHIFFISVFRKSGKIKECQGALEEKYMLSKLNKGDKGDAMGKVR